MTTLRPAVAPWRSATSAIAVRSRAAVASGPNSAMSRGRAPAALRRAPSGSVAISVSTLARCSTSGSYQRWPLTSSPNTPWSSGTGTRRPSSSQLVSSSMKAVFPLNRLATVGRPIAIASM
jgi:hypothetical protein